MNRSYVENDSQRIIYLDVLRVLSTAAVMLTHISVQNWYKADIYSMEWMSYNFFDAISKWAVPVFVMISGSLFLPKKELTIGLLIKKYILRIVIAFITWSAIYTVVNCYRGMPLQEAIAGFFTGYYHMWYLYMIVGLYLITPILQLIIKNENALILFLVLGFVFGIVFPQAQNLLYEFFPLIGNSTKSIMEDLNYHLSIGYSFYYVLGYYLSKKEITIKIRGVIYVLGIFGFVSTIFLSMFMSWYRGEPNAIFFDRFSINIFLEAIFVFVLFRYKEKRLSEKYNERQIVWLRRLSSYSFGAYLVHALIIGILHMVFHLSTDSFNPVLSVPVIELSVLIISFIVSAIIHHIPVINKYIV